MSANERVQHTQGPWEVDGIEITYGGQGICLMGEPAQYAGDFARMLPNYEANARLIAASPTMYEYVAKRAAGGDTEAATIMEEIHAS